MSATTTTTQTTVNGEQKIDNDVVQGQFIYWAENRDNDPSETLAVVNGESKSLACATLPVYDIRPQLASLSHERHGFEIVKHESAILGRLGSEFDFAKLNDRDSGYWQEVRQLVKQKLHVRSVVVINSVIRESTNDKFKKDIHPRGLGQASAPIKPFHFVHNDYSAPGARTSLRAMLHTFFVDTKTDTMLTKEEQKEFFRLRTEILSAEKEAIKQSKASDHLTWDGKNYGGPRWGHFSIWRPIEIVEQDPLAILDPNSLFDGIDLHDEEKKPYIRSRALLKGRTGFLAEYEYTSMLPIVPRGEQNHKWLYVKDQRPEEVNFLKLFDSEAWKEGSGIMPCAPHSAFSLPERKDTPLRPRRSIETRVLVVW
jgi:hypothetical protein